MEENYTKVIYSTERPDDLPKSTVKGLHKPVSEVTDIFFHMFIFLREKYLPKTSPVAQTRQEHCCHSINNNHLCKWLLLISKKN